MYKDLLVPMTSTAGDAAALDVAIALATAHAAHVSVLELLVLPSPVPAPWGVMPDVALAEVYAELRAQGAERLARLRERLAATRLSNDCRLIEAMVDPARDITALAHHVDLSVVAGAAGDTREARVPHAHIGSLLLASGRPVLVVPAGCDTPMPPRRVAVAWRSTSEATRSLHDALPLLVGAEAVDLVLVDPEPGEAAGGSALPGTGIATHLARHGVHVQVVTRESRGRGVAATLLEHAREMPAQLLVAGGYGHSRLRQWAFGGTTRELLMSAGVPVFLSH